jgi:hypothetical protein
MFVVIAPSYRYEFGRFDVVSGPCDYVRVYEGCCAVMYDAVAYLIHV